MLLDATDQTPEELTKAGSGLGELRNHHGFWGGFWLRGQVRGQPHASEAFQGVFCIFDVCFLRVGFERIDQTLQHGLQ